MSKKSDTKQHDPYLAREIEKYQTPVPSREFILCEFKELGIPQKRRALLEHFELEDPELKEAFRRRLKAMVRDGQLLKTPQGYFPIAKMETCQGVIVMEREGEGYLKTEEGQTVNLSGPTLRGYYDGDIVDVQITQIEKDGTTKGRIVNLIEKVIPLVVGRLVKTQHQFELLPFDRKFTQNITIPKDKKGSAKNGDIVQVKILRDKEQQFHVEPVAEVLEVLGDFSTPGIEIKIALKKFNIPNEWPKAVLKECEKFNSKNIRPEAAREDMTDLPLVTIDGEDAKDFDDAVYCERKRQGGWYLYVAIADVSYYVQPGSHLDKEATNRGNSTYFPGFVVPMLPEALSNELCSLKPKVPRYCVICQMTIDAKGQISRYKFYRALMQSKARLTYTIVAEILRGNETLRKEYAEQLPSLEALHELYLTLNEQRKARGAIDFDTQETRILFDPKGKIKSIVPQTRNVAHKMIEESMLAANVCAAKFLQKNKRPTLFRVHDRPPSDKLSNLREFLSELGLDLPGRQTPTAADFSTLLHRIAHREDKHVIETVMLRSLSQAQYSPKNIGHFGLAYPSYLHFTSPIRRYPDLLVHRGIMDAVGSSLFRRKKNSQMDFEKMGLHLSQTERRSDEATRDASLALKCHFMQDKVGQHFRGVISGVASFGIFVELKDIYIEGLVHVTALGNEYFYYDSPHHRMVGERTRTVYRLGDSVEVIVMRVDVEDKKIDLELANLPKARARSSKNISHNKSKNKYKKDSDHEQGSNEYKPKRKHKHKDKQRRS